MKKGFEFKVGVFVIVGLGLSAISLFMVGSGDSIFSPQLHYVARFQNIEGLIEGAKVVISGLSVGSVKQITLDSQNKNIAVFFFVHPNAGSLITKNAQVEISTQGVLGDKFINIITGDTNAEPLPDNSDIKTSIGSDLNHLFLQSKDLITVITSLANSADHILKAFEKQNRADILFQNLTTTSTNLTNLSKSINTKLNELNIKKSVDTLNQILNKVNEGSGALSMILNDPGLYDQLKDLLGGANRNRVLRNLIRDTVHKNEKSNSP